jgi:predicted nucleotidyltransferase
MHNKSFSSVKVFYPPYDREELVALLRQRITALQEKLPLKRVVLFGSYAKGKETVASDVDLLVVYAGRPRTDAYELVRRGLNIRRLEPHVYTEEEYNQAKMTVERMIRDGISIAPEEHRCTGITAAKPRAAFCSKPEAADARDS